MHYRILFVATVAACLGWSADFWHQKRFTEWSNKEVQKVMTDSPWAHQTNATPDRSRTREAAPPGGGEPGFSDIESGMGGGGGRGGGGRRGGGGAMGGGPPMGPPAIPVLVRWHSSLTIRQALVRAQFGDEAGTSDKAAEFLTRPQNFYVVTVSGLPLRFFQRVDPQELQQALKQSASLHVRGLPDVNPGDIQFQATEQSLTVFFAFPRSQEIQVEHKEAEFISNIGPLQVKRKFKLAEMVRDGRLDL